MTHVFLTDDENGTREVITEHLLQDAKPCIAAGVNIHTIAGHPIMSLNIGVGTPEELDMTLYLLSHAGFAVLMEQIVEATAQSPEYCLVAARAIMKVLERHEAR